VGYPYPAPVFYACPYPYPTFVVDQTYPAYLCIAEVDPDEDTETHVTQPWGYAGHDGGQWTYDYIDAEYWALEACEAYHSTCYISKCFQY
jgi:hypothetical protein